MSSRSRRPRAGFGSSDVTDVAGEDWRTRTAHARPSIRTAGPSPPIPRSPADGCGREPTRLRRPSRRSRSPTDPLPPLGAEVHPTRHTRRAVDRLLAWAWLPSRLPTSSEDAPHRLGGSRRDQRRGRTSLVSSSVVIATLTTIAPRHPVVTHQRETRRRDRQDSI